MIELLSILISFLILFSFSLFPLKIVIANNKNSYNYKSVFDLLLLNLSINIFVIFLISFTNLDYSKYFLLIMSASIIFNLYNFLKIKNYFDFIKDNIFIFFLLLNFIIAIYLTANPILAWDGLENWYFKAQNFFYNYNFFDLKGLKGNNNYYPHLGTLIWGFFWKNSLLEYEYLGRLFFIYIYLLSIFSICDLLNKSFQFKVIVLSLITLLCFDDFLFRGYQEILLFSFFIFISKNFYIYVVDKKTVNLFICFIWLNLIPWIKHEGFLFVLVFTFSIFLIFKYFPKKFEIFLFVASSWILIFLKNFIFYKYLDLNFVHGGGNKFFGELNLTYEFSYLFFIGFIISIVKYKIWIFIFIALYFLSKTKLTNINETIFQKFLKINLILYLLLLLGIYYNLYTNSELDFKWWIDTTLDRLLYSISGIFVITVILYINRFKNYILK